MLAWLSKQLTPAPARECAAELVSCVTLVRWGQTGWIASGGARTSLGDKPAGALRAIHLVPAETAKGLTAPPSVGLEDVLSAHDAPLSAVEWGDPAQKTLATADTNGLVIVWAYAQGAWREVLVNRRDGVAVTALKWSADGQLVAIAYADGGVVVGSADGTRLWARDDISSGRGVTTLEWSPDGQTLLLGCGGSLPGNPPAVLMYSAQHGSPQALLALPALAGLQLSAPHAEVAAIEWHDRGGAPGSSDPRTRSLAIGFRNGRVQLMTCEADPAPVLLDTGLHVSEAKWSPDGSALAIAGCHAHSGACSVQFYSQTGRFLSALPIPAPEEEAATQLARESGGGRDVADPQPNTGCALASSLGVAFRPSLSWDPTGVRLVVSSATSLFFASVRLPRMWAPVGDDSVAVAHHTPDHDGASTLTLVNTSTGETRVKHVRRLVGLHGSSDGESEHFALVCWQEPEAGAADDGTPSGVGADLHVLGLTGTDAPPKGDSYVAILCDSLGAPVESRTLPFRPEHVTLTASHLVAFNPQGDRVAVWDISRLSEALTEPLASKRDSGATPAADDTLPVRLYALNAAMHSWSEGSVPPHPATSPISAAAPACCVAARGSCVFVAREDGSVLRYELPSMELAARFQLRTRPLRMDINCDCSRLLVTDSESTASLVDLQAQGAADAQSPESWPGVWSTAWADDAPDMWAACVQGRICTFRGTTPDAPQPGWVARPIFK